MSYRSTLLLVAILWAGVQGLEEEQLPKTAEGRAKSLTDSEMLNILDNAMQEKESRAVDSPSPRAADGEEVADGKRSSMKCRFKSSALCQALYSYPFKKEFSEADMQSITEREVMDGGGDTILDKRSSTSRCRYKNAFLCQSLYSMGNKRGLEIPQQRTIGREGVLEDKRSSTSRCRYKNAFLCQSIYSMGNKRSLDTPQQIDQSDSEELLFRLRENRAEYADLLQDLDTLSGVA